MSQTACLRRVSSGATSRGNSRKPSDHDRWVRWQGAEVLDAARATPESERYVTPRLRSALEQREIE